MKPFLKALATLLCLAALTIVVLVILLPYALGMQRYVITGASMTGEFPKGSVIYSRLTPVEQLKVGDVITFYPPGYDSPVTHRIISIGTDENGKRMYETKGDYNATADPWKVNLVEPQQARYVFHIPYVGYFLAALSLRSVRMVLIGLPAVIIAVSVLWSLWTQAGDEVKRQEAEEAAAKPASPGEPADAGSPA